MRHSLALVIVLIAMVIISVASCAPASIDTDHTNYSTVVEANEFLNVKTVVSYPLARVDYFADPINENECYIFYARFVDGSGIFCLKK